VLLQRPGGLGTLFLVVTAARIFANNHATTARAHALDVSLLLRLRTRYEVYSSGERPAGLRVRQRLPVSLLECPGYDSEIAVAEPVIDDLLPFVGQTGKRMEAVVAGRL